MLARSLIEPGGGVLLLSLSTVRGKPTRIALRTNYQYRFLRGPRPGISHKTKMEQGNITRHTGRESRGKNWMFTLNNYNDEQQQMLRAMVPNTEFLIFGREVGESGTPHLQGFVRFKNRIVFNKVARLIPGSHLTLSSYPDKAAEYCRKDGDFEEFGTLPLQESGKRSDLDQFKEAVIAGLVPSKEVLMDDWASMYARYPKFCMEYIDIKRPKTVVKEHRLRDWQQKLYTDLEKQVDDRTVIFIVDRSGNSGKSWFCDYVRQLKSNVQILTPGKKADMAHEYDPSSKILFMDAPRSKQSDFIQYDFLEDVKNGRIFSPKYESRMKFFERPHVVIMMNEDPDMTKLSEDRYDVRYV